MTEPNTSLSADQYQVGGNHYQSMPIQPWEVMQTMMTPEQFEGFLLGNYLKYSMRAGRKAEADIDVNKARHYAAKLQEFRDSKLQEQHDAT